MLFNGTNQMMLVSYKNNNIWPGYGQNMARMPIFGHTFLGTQETITYRLVLRI